MADRRDSITVISSEGIYTNTDAVTASASDEPKN